MHVSETTGQLGTRMGNAADERRAPPAMPPVSSTAPLRVMVELIRQFDFRSYSQGDLRSALLRWKLRPQEQKATGPLAEAFAVVNEAISRSLGIQATDEQLIAGLHLLRGNVVQMNAGEGKTIAAAFPAVVQAIDGRQVHIITSNDYLAARDANFLTPVYRSLGIAAGAVLDYMEDEERKLAYQKGIIYSTMRELAFDFLRDNLKFNPRSQLQGKLDVAIIDEVDHALIDEAFTPIIISGKPISHKRAVIRVNNVIAEMIASQGEAVQVLAEQAALPDLDSRDASWLLARLLLAEPENAGLKRQLAEHPAWFKTLRSAANQDFHGLTGDLLYAVDPDGRFITLTAKGREFLEQRLGPFYDGRSLEEALDSIWASGDGTLSQRRKQADVVSRRLTRQYNLGNQIHQTLRAHLLLRRDVDYFVNEEAIVLIDRSTGRPRPDCIFQQGLQAALESKEGLTPHPDREILGQISVQGFIGRYQRVCGITGTASSSEGEFREKYGLRVAVLPPSNPLNRVDLGYRVYLTRTEKVAAIIGQVETCHRAGQPVLVGTPTVERSEELSRLLSEKGIAHRLLNAVTRHNEAEAVKDAGKLGAVTVATNMAGRGTDILLEDGLNAMIGERYVGLIAQALSQGAGCVEVICHTPEETDLLESQLAGSPRPVTVIVLEFGLGLHVIGTEIHDTPRTGLQLNGRSGRQGEFGVTQTILSLEDILINLHADGVLKLGGCRETDPAGRTYFAGPALAKHIEGVQEMAQREGEVLRGLMQDYGAVLDRHTDNYYRWRQGLMDDFSPRGFFAAAAVGCASALVARHFPELTSETYRERFDRLVDEVQLDYRIDCSGLFGGDFNRLPQELSQLLLSHIEDLEIQLGPKDFAAIAGQLLLQTADESWRDHIIRLQGFIANQMLAATNHKSSVAHYIRRSFEAWDGFQEAVTGQFLSLLLTFPLTRTKAHSPETTEKLNINDDVGTLISDLKADNEAGNEAGNEADRAADGPGIGRQAVAIAAD